MQLRDHEGVKGKRDAYPFDPRLLKIDFSYNVRDLSSPDAVEKLGELKESIRANGVRMPLEVRLDGDDVFIVAGHRRHKAVMELIDEGAEIETVLVLHEAKGTNDAERTLNLVVSNSGEPLKPLEVAEVVRRLVNYGWTEAQVMARLGWKSTATVRQHLDMLAMPAAVQQQVRDGDVSATLAVKITKQAKEAKADPEFAAQLIAANKEENKRLGVGVRHKVTPRTIKRDAKPKPAAPAEPAPPVAVFAQPPEPESISLPAAIEELETHPVNGVNGDADAVAFDPLTNQDIIAAIRPIAGLAEQWDLNEIADDHLIPVLASDIKRVALVYARVTGGER
jgi:ParB/RepB/Spo0J family partition protein